MAIVNTIIGFLNTMDNLKDGFQNMLTEICNIVEEIDPGIVRRLVEDDERIS